MAFVNIYSFKIFVYQVAEFVLGKQKTSSLYKSFLFRNYNKSGIIYVHIPKTGGTSVSDILYGKRVGHFTASEIENWFGVDKFHSMKSFAVVRNPYDRLVSAYRFVQNAGGSQGSVRKNPAFISPHFETFDGFVRNWLIRQDPSRIDLLFRPQHFFIFDHAGECKVDWVCKIEDTGELEAGLSGFIGNPVTLPKLNTGLPQGMPIDYNIETKRLVRDFYYQDFLYFKYDQELS